MTIGVFPIIEHYYEPLFNAHQIRDVLRQDRNMPGIDLNIKEQLNLLSQFNFNDELVKFPLDILQNSRIEDAGPDLGAYERIEK